MNSVQKAELARDASDPAIRGTPEAVARVRPWRLRFQAWMRWLHIYTSMLSLMVVLFFSLTGITLNHPDWLFGTGEVRQEYTGSLPKNAYSSNTVNWLEVVEHLRASHNIKGKATDMRVANLEASLRFAAPGYTADGFIDLKTGAYIHCATDVKDYAEQMLAVLSANPHLRNASTSVDGYHSPQNPFAHRPTTKFEARGQSLGHGMWDLVFIKK